MQICGPFSYSGNKYRIYSKHLKNYFDGFEKIHEPFCGSGVCLYNSKKGGNGIDNDSTVILLHNSLRNDDLVDKMKEEYYYHFPDGTRTKEGYSNLRSKFNKSWKENKVCKENIHLLHLLVQLSFNSLIRFGPNGFNVPIGRREVDFDRIILHQNILKEKEISFTHGNYDELSLDFDSKKEIIYFDPPYVASKYQYNGWNKEDEIELLKYLDRLNRRKIKFVLSNTFLHRGVKNDELIEWSKKYNVNFIKMSYNAWAAAVKGVNYENDTIEVIIKNFGTKVPLF